jgi:hypothetical protein
MGNEVSASFFVPQSQYAAMRALLSIWQARVIGAYESPEVKFKVVQMTVLVDTRLAYNFVAE